MDVFQSFEADQQLAALFHAAIIHEDYAAFNPVSFQSSAHLKQYFEDSWLLLSGYFFFFFKLTLAKTPLFAISTFLSQALLCTQTPEEDCHSPAPPPALPTPPQCFAAATQNQISANP